jgi:hypothetical protein
MANELIDYVDVQITEDTIGLAGTSFDVPLILAPDAPFPERSRIYRSLPGYEADGAVVGGPSWLALRAMLSQNPHPANIMIGKMVNRPTMVYTITPTARDSHLYQIRVRGPGVTETLVQFTSGVGATAATVSVGLIVALNAVTGKNFTATGTATVVVTGNAVGNWFSLEILDRNDLSVAQTNTDPGVTSDLSAIALFSQDFYGIYSPFQSSAVIGAISDWAESNGRIYMAETSDTVVASTSAGSGDVMDDAKDNQLARTAVWFHPSPAEMLTAALLGKVLPLEAGSETWFGKSLAGVLGVKLSPTERSNIVSKNGNSYEIKARRGVTFNGMTGDGDFIDIQRGQDWVTDQMALSIASILFGAPTKVPFTDAGIARVENGIKGVLRRAVNRQIAAEDVDPPSPTTFAPKAIDVPTLDRAARRLSGMLATYRQQGAIHKVFVRITVSI